MEIMETDRLIFLPVDQVGVLQIAYLASYRVDFPFHLQDQNPFVSIVTSPNGKPLSLQDMQDWLSCARRDVPNIFDEPNLYSALALYKDFLPEDILTMFRYGTFPESCQAAEIWQTLADSVAGAVKLRRVDGAGYMGDYARPDDLSLATTSWLVPHFRSDGSHKITRLTVELGEVLKEVAFERLLADNLLSRIHHTNIPSIRSAQKRGFSACTTEPDADGKLVFSFTIADYFESLLQAANSTEVSLGVELAG